MAAPHHNPLIRHLPVGAAIAVAVVAAAGFALMPAAMLEQMVWRTGVAALIPAAQPPLGSTARAVLALAFGAVGAAVTWSALFLLVGPGGLIAPRPRRDDDLPSVRRADAHPDAPPRRPMTAADLGTPMMDVHAVTVEDPERPIPSDLDQPLAAFDPLAILLVPMEPVRPVAPLLTIADPRPAVVFSGAIVEDGAEGPDLERDVTAHAAVSADPEPAGIEIGAEPEIQNAIEAVPVFTAVKGTVITAPTLSWSSERSEPPIGSVPTLVADAPRVDRSDAQPSIESLLRRLEQGSMRRRRHGAS